MLFFSWTRKQTRGSSWKAICGGIPLLLPLTSVTPPRNAQLKRAKGVLQHFVTSVAVTPSEGILLPRTSVTVTANPLFSRLRACHSTSVTFVTVTTFFQTPPTVKAFFLCHFFLSVCMCMCVLVGISRWYTCMQQRVSRWRIGGVTWWTTAF